MAFESYTFGMFFNDCAKYIAYIFDTVLSLFICLTNLLGGLLITLLNYYFFQNFLLRWIFHIYVIAMF